MKLINNVIINNNVHIAQSADILGDVTIKDNSSIWFNCVIRGDVDKVVIGENTNIQDGAVLHCTENKPLIIGNNVTVGHNAIVHGCNIGDNVLVGMGAIIMDDSIIGNNVIVAAGTVIPQNKVIPDGKVVIGNPGKIVRDINENDIKHILDNSKNYIKLALKYLSKN